jgi:hypothetical protein
MAVAIGTKRKGGQAIENKQSREITRFRAPMISRTYGQRRETARFARRKNPFAFAGFSASSRPKTQGSEINGGFKARAAESRRSATRNWRRRFQSLGGNRSGELRLRRFAHNWRREPIFFIFLLVTH